MEGGCREAEVVGSGRDYGVTDRTMRRWRERRLNEHGYSGLWDYDFKTALQTAGLVKKHSKPGPLRKRRPWRDAQEPDR